MKKEVKKGPKGIGGWLILPTIGFFLFAVLYSFSGVGGILMMLFSPEGTKPSFWITYLLALVLGIFAILLLVKEFKKKKQFPKWAIIYIWMNFIISFVLVIMDKGTYGISFWGLFWAVIWSWYFSVSKRVKNTFVK